MPCPKNTCGKNPLVPGQPSFKVRKRCCVPDQLHEIAAQVETLTIGMNYLMHEQFHIQKFECTGEVVTFDLPASEVSLSVLAGGGAGGEAHVATYNVSGGGGGAGGAINSLNLTIPSPTTATLYVGCGGCNPGEDGEDSYITINGVTYTVYGGSAANLNIGGEGGKGYICGKNGQDGSIQIPSLPTVYGGNGGNSEFGYGGVLSGSVSEPDGGPGAGGSGANPFGTIIGCGGNGLITLEIHEEVQVPP